MFCIWYPSALDNIKNPVIRKILIVCYVLLFQLSVYLLSGIVLVVTASYGVAHIQDATISKLLDVAAPQPLYFNARDGTRLAFRHYPTGHSLSTSVTTPNILIMIHAQGADSRYLIQTARFVAASGIAQVFTPDLRGHGRSGYERGDVAYVGQLEDDLRDLMDHILQNHIGQYTSAQIRFVLAGHSVGGGFVLRCAANPSLADVKGFILLAPFVSIHHATVRERTDVWGSPRIRAVIGLLMMNAVGIHAFDGYSAIDLPYFAEEPGLFPSTYSYRMMQVDLTFITILLTRFRLSTRMQTSPKILKPSVIDHFLLLLDKTMSIS